MATKSSSQLRSTEFTIEEDGQYRYIGIVRDTGTIQRCNKKSLAPAIEEYVSRLTDDVFDTGKTRQLNVCRRGLRAFWRGIRVDYQNHFPGRDQHSGKQFANLAVQVQKLVFASAHIETGVHFGRERIQRALNLSLMLTNSSSSENCITVKLIDTTN
jgi:hypothetical protein